MVLFAYNEKILPVTRFLRVLFCFYSFFSNRIVMSCKN